MDLFEALQDRWETLGPDCPDNMSKIIGDEAQWITTQDTGPLGYIMQRSPLLVSEEQRSPLSKT